MANARKRINYIGKIRREERFVENPGEVKEVIADFFENLYSEEDFHRPTLEGLHFPSISLEMKQ